MKCRTRPLYQSKIKREREREKNEIYTHKVSTFLNSLKYPGESLNFFPTKELKKSIKKWHKIGGDKAWFRYNRPDRLYFLKNQLPCGSVSIVEGIVNENCYYWLENVSSFLGFWSSFCRHSILIDLIMWQIPTLSLRQSESKNDGRVNLNKNMKWMKGTSAFDTVPRWRMS